MNIVKWQISDLFLRHREPIPEIFSKEALSDTIKAVSFHVSAQVAPHNAKNSRNVLISM